MLNNRTSIRLLIYWLLLAWIILMGQKRQESECVASRCFLNQAWRHISTTQVFFFISSSYRIWGKWNLMSNISNNGAQPGVIGRELFHWVVEHFHPGWSFQRVLLSVTKKCMCVWTKGFEKYLHTSGQALIVLFVYPERISEQRTFFPYLSVIQKDLTFFTKLSLFVTLHLIRLSDA